MEQRKEETARAGQGVKQAAVRSAGMTAAQQSDSRVYRLVVMAMLIGLGVVISPILRVEGMCPMAHLINITGAVLLGPWYSFVIAAIIGILRMTLMGIPPLALTGAVFGATLSGILYRLSGGRLWTAVVGELHV